MAVYVQRPSCKIVKVIQGAQMLQIQVARAGGRGAM